MAYALSFIGPVAQLNRAAAFYENGASVGKQNLRSGCHRIGEPLTTTWLYGNTEETSDLPRMFLHHTKTKGDLGVLKVKVDLCLQEFLICTPETEHAPFDLVIYKKGTFRTVQVKYRNLTHKGNLEIPFSNSYSTSRGVITRRIDKSIIDLYAIYCPQTDACYYLEPKEFKGSITLRVNTPRNNQRSRIHFADDFRKVP